MTSGNPIVDAIGEMNYEGNIVSHAWYQSEKLKFPSGKVNLVAVILLADIIYWYRPTVIRDERSNRIVEVRRKFKGHRLHKDYKWWADYFGVTERQVRDAITFLVDAGLIIREVQKPLSYTFFEPIPEAIFEITFPDKFEAGSRLTFERETTHVEALEGSRSNVNGVTLERETSTESTTKSKHKALVIKKLDARSQQTARIAFANLDAADQQYITRVAEDDGTDIETAVWKYRDSEAARALKAGGK